MWTDHCGVSYSSSSILLHLEDMGQASGMLTLSTEIQTAKPPEFFPDYKYATRNVQPNTPFTGIDTDAKYVGVPWMLAIQCKDVRPAFGSSTHAMNMLFQSSKLPWVFLLHYLGFCLV